MAAGFDYSALTMNPEEARAVSEAIFEQVYTKPVLKKVHGFMPGIQMKTQIPFLGLLGMVGKAANGCTPNTSSEKPALTEKFADPALVSFRLVHCEADVPQLFKLWKRDAVAADTWEEASEVIDFMTDRAIDGTANAILRISSFGDKLADNVADGGYITTGVDPTFFTMINGLWQQIFAASTLTRYTIPENGEATKAAQAALASDRALNVLRYMTDNCDSRIFDMNQADVKYQVTRSLWNNLRNFYEDKSLGFTIQRAEDGTMQLYYNGYEVVVRHDWDRNIKANNNLGATFLNPNRAIFGPISNIPIITSDEGSMNKVKSFYDPVTMSWYLDVAFYLDCVLLQEPLIAVAY